VRSRRARPVHGLSVTLFRDSVERWQRLVLASYDRRAPLSDHQEHQPQGLSPIEGEEESQSRAAREG